MKIGIIGAGNIGGTLGKLWANRGHEVVFGVRSPDKLAGLLAECGPTASATDIRAAAVAGDVVVLAVPWSAVSSALAAAGHLTDKIIIDTTNPIEWDDGPVLGGSHSVAEDIAGRNIGAHVVKAFNAIGAENLASPDFQGNKADIYFATDDDAGRRITRTLIEDLGFTAVDAGPLRNARLLENLAILWIHLASVGGMGRHIAFKVLAK